jgi:hypothetical protein
MRLEELCSHPKTSIKRMASFVGAEVDQNTLRELACLPALPASSGRYRNHDLAVFTAEDINAVKSFGYKDFL